MRPASWLGPAIPSAPPAIKDRSGNHRRGLGVHQTGTLRHENDRDGGALIIPVVVQFKIAKAVNFDGVPLLAWCRPNEAVPDSRVPTPGQNSPTARGPGQLAALSGSPRCMAANPTAKTHFRGNFFRHFWRRASCIRSRNGNGIAYGRPAL